MASYKSVQLTLVDGQGAERLENGDAFGRVRRDYFSYNSDTGLALNDTVELARLPAGARVGGIFISNEDLDSGSTLTFDLGLKATDGNGVIDNSGTADDPDLFVTDSTAFQGAVVVPTNVVDEVAGVLYLTEKAVTVELTVSAAATGLTADADIKGYVEYVVD